VHAVDSLEATTGPPTCTTGVEEVRNEKLRRIDEDFHRGIRHGQRLGETPREEFMSRPDFLRRENKITTAPSSAGREFFNSRRTSLKRLLDSHRQNKGSAGPKLGDLKAIDESGRADAPLQAIGVDGAGVEDGGAGVLPTSPSPSIRPQGGGKQWRSRSVCAGPSVSAHSPKRLSYIGALSCQEERNLASMYAEKRKSTDCTVLDPSAPGDSAKPVESPGAPNAPTKAAGRQPEALAVPWQFDRGDLVDSILVDVERRHGQGSQGTPRALGGAAGGEDSRAGGCG